jgi:hypothetical protein
MPFPSNVYTVADARSPTGRRVALKQELFPIDYLGRQASPDPWNRGDGFSTGSSIMAHFPGVTQDSVTAAGFPTLADLGRSLEDDCPSVLLDAETGERVLHWVDLDATGDSDAQRAFMIRPAVRLQDSRRYIVGIRGLVDDAGEAIAASPAFAALRDGTDSTDVSVQERRALYRNIFAHLQQAGVSRGDLQLAWDFTTQSREHNTGWMVHMRDEALQLIEADGGIQYEITSVDEELDPDNIAYRLYVDMRVPMYLDQYEPGAYLNFGQDGMPEPSPIGGPWAKFSVEILIPHSAVQSPAPLLQYGHGQLGEKEQVESGNFRTFINEYNYIFFGVDFIGFAYDDEVFVGSFLDNGRFDQFESFMERQHQGMLNSLLAMRMMKTTFAADPVYGRYLDPSQSYYYGISQGGIYGGTYMALTTDVERGALGVMGMPYNILLSRSANFDEFFLIMRSNFMDAREHMFLLDLAQMLWDRMDPNGYAPYVRQNTLPGTLPHEVLMRAAVGDYQVTTYGAHIMANSIGVPHLDSGVRPVYQLETVPGPVTGSAYIEYDFGLPPVPLGNIPPEKDECKNVHESVRRLESARQQLDKFLREGVIENFCPNGVCKFPEVIPNCD